MKKKIQKYLAGEREGFSLVELIIVIAIMAILIGVVTLAVLPNIAKSKESKDMTALDSILSAVNNAVASQQVSTSGDFLMTKGTDNKFAFPAAPTGTPSTADKVAAEVKKLMGKNSIELTSSQALTGNAIRCSWSFTSGSIGITVDVVKTPSGGGSATTVVSEYLGDFKVSN